MRKHSNYRLDKHYNIFTRTGVPVAYGIGPDISPEPERQALALTPVPDTDPDPAPSAPTPTSDIIIRFFYFNKKWNYSFYDTTFIYSLYSDRNKDLRYKKIDINNILYGLFRDIKDIKKDRTYYYRLDLKDLWTTHKTVTNIITFLCTRQTIATGHFANNVPIFFDINSEFDRALWPLHSKNILYKRKNQAQTGSVNVRPDH